MHLFSRKRIEKNLNYTEMEFILSIYLYVFTYIEISMSSREFEDVCNFLTLPRKISKYCINIYDPSNLRFNLIKQILCTLRTNII